MGCAHRPWESNAWMIGRHGLAARYGCAVASIALATCLRLLLDPVLDGHAQFITFSFAILVTAAYGGFGPALAAVICGGLASIYFFLPPRFSFALPDVKSASGWRST